MRDEEIDRLRKAKNNVKIYWFVAEKPKNKVIFKKSDGVVGLTDCSIEEIKLL